jgi:hypothetical protein
MRCPCDGTKCGELAEAVRPLDDASDCRETDQERKVSCRRTEFLDELAERGVLRILVSTDLAFGDLSSARTALRGERAALPGRCPAAERPECPRCDSAWEGSLKRHAFTQLNVREHRSPLWVSITVPQLQVTET